MRSIPTIAITMGDAAGIGPEVTVKALARRELYSMCSPLVVGSRPIIERAIRLCGLPLKVESADGLQGATSLGTIEVLDPENLDPKKVSFGKVSPAAGKASMEYVERAAEMAMKKQVAAIVTAPINKESAIQGGYKDLGHLELLQRLSGAKQCATMLLCDQLRVAHLSTHKSLAKACRFVTRKNVLERLRLVHTSFQQWGFSQPRIGVVALNPHAGESGLLGDEEEKAIIPAVQQAQGEGIDARGPFPADSIFARALAAEFDVVLAMYHDQGHIAAKVYDFNRTIGMTLGLPFIRTSVEHGTAYDIAWRGIASAESMVEAIKLAVSLGAHQRLP